MDEELLRWLVQQPTIDEVERLIDKLKNWNVPDRNEAAKRLGKIGDVRAVEPLIDALKDENWEVQMNAAEALGKLKDEQAVPGLIEALATEEPLVRSSAVWSLGELNAVRALELLIGALDDEFLGARKNAVGALAKIAENAGLDLREVRASLKEFVEQRDPDEREKTKRWLASAYAKIAAAVAKRKESQMGGVLSTGKIKPPKKGMYRTRRAVNG